MKTNSTPVHYEVGQNIDGYTVTNFKEILEIQCTLIELEHNRTGAKIQHIANNDPENVFCLNFRTLPDSSNGVAHILEHTVLCGSKKYPIKDAFFAMNRRSLNTFMNAFTGADFTSYPAASQIEADFYNLLDVYLDAVFNPRLAELSFLQEGHRLEFENPEDSSTPLLYKGVVYNEMKGSLSNPTTRIIEAMNESLFPNSPYGYNSGGDPLVIPELSYKEFVEFHKKNYHPSRCLFCFYGNIPLEKHLTFLSKHILNNIERAPSLEPIAKQKRLTHPVHREIYYPIAKDEDTTHKTYIAFGWLTCSTLDSLTLLGLSILDIILMDTDASYLKKEILKSGLAKQASSTMDSEISEVSYMLLLKGCDAESQDKLQELIMNTLLRLVQEGIESAVIERALHQLELAKLEITGDSYPFGLSLIFRTALLNQHGGKAEDGLRIHSLFEDFNETLKHNPHFLQDLIIYYFINNPHHARITMMPDKELEAREAAHEQEKLQKIRDSLTKEQIETIICQSQKLLEMQEEDEEAKEIYDILPKIALEDVPKKARTLTLERKQFSNTELFFHPDFTNHITYCNLIFPIAETKHEDLWLVRLFSSLLTQMGNNGKSYQDVLEYMQENTGGISSFISINSKVNSPQDFSPTFNIRGKSLYEKAPKLFSLLFDMAQDPNLTDRQRLKELIQKYYTNLSGSLNQSALRYAVNLGAQFTGPLGVVENELYGLPYFYKIKELAHNFDSMAPKLIEDLERIKTHCLCTQGSHLVVTCDQTEMSRYIEMDFEGLIELPSQAHTPWKVHTQTIPSFRKGKIISSQISFSTAVCKSVPYSHPDTPLLSLAAALFDNITLHKRIREQGGAYGAGAVSNAMSGLFYFYSYRDPNVVSTIDAFKEAVQAIAEGDFSDDDLESAKLEILQAMDSPISPGSRGDVAYSWYIEGKTYEMRQAHRDKILAATCDDVKKAVLLHLSKNLQDASYVTFGGEELLERENAKLMRLGIQPFDIEKI